MPSIESEKIMDEIDLILMDCSTNTVHELVKELLIQIDSEWGGSDSFKIDYLKEKIKLITRG